MTSRAPIAVALDAPDLNTAAHWADLVTPHVSTLKIGLELYLRFGPDAVASVRGPRGVGRVPRPEAARHSRDRRRRRERGRQGRPDLLTVHAAAGAAAIKAAVDALPDTRIVGGDGPDLAQRPDLDEIGMAGPVSDAVRRLAALAVSAGARGLVCSPQEVAAVRAEVGPDITLITPGVRPSGESSHDQARVATPKRRCRPARTCS